MKILQVNAGTENGGGRTIIINLIRALRKNNIDVQLLVFEKGPVADWAAKYKIPTTVMNQEGRLDLRVVHRLRKFIVDNKIDVVNTHGPRANFIMSLVSKKVKTKWVVTIHSNPLLDFSDNIKGKLLTQMNIRALKKAEHFILITPKFQPVLEEIGIDKNRMGSIFNAMDFSEELPQTVHHDVFSLVNVARLTLVKNQALLLKTLAQVDFDFRLKIVGDGELRKQLQDLSRNLGLETKVEFTGFYDDTSPYYHKSDLFILTSNSEGFPLVLLEAANFGIPAIATDVGSCDQIISDGTGWLIPPADSDKLKEALIAAYKKWQEDQLRPMGQKFYQYCSQNFSSQRLSQALMDVYQSL